MEVEDKNTQLHERDAQIHRQQRELRVRNAGRGYCAVVVMPSILSLNVRRTGGGYRWKWRRRTPNSERETLNCSDGKQNSKKRTCSSADNRESYKH